MKENSRPYSYRPIHNKVMGFAPDYIAGHCIYRGDIECFSVSIVSQEEMEKYIDILNDVFERAYLDGYGDCLKDIKNDLDKKGLL